MPGTTVAEGAPPGFAGHFGTDENARRSAAEATGILRILPQAVAVPRNAADVETLLRWANRTNTALVPRGAGTGMPGGNVGSGVAVDMVRHFGTIGPLDFAARTARVEPGVVLASLNAACAPGGLLFPIDPSSGARCTLGGMIANNSAGAHGVRYGATRRWVRAIDVVLADGTRCRAERGRPPADPRLQAILTEVDSALRPARERIHAEWPRVRKNSSGYALNEYLQSGDAVDLLVGSEGTLAIVVAAELALAPLPAHRGLALLEFTSLEAAGAAVQTLLPLHPATCEMLDRTFLELVRSAEADSAFPLRSGLEAILLVETAGETAGAVEQWLANLQQMTRSLAARITLATDPEQQHRLWSIRHAASPLIAARADGRVSMQFIEDGVVPVDRLPEYVSELRRILAHHQLPAVIFGHAGDGNLHVNPLVDVGEPRWQVRLEAVLAEVAACVARLGGTLAGEHGDGRLRAPLLETVWGADMVALFRRVKQAFDPRGILNPGVILPLPGQRPLDALRVFPPGKRDSAKQPRSPGKTPSSIAPEPRPR